MRFGGLGRMPFGVVKCTVNPLKSDHQKCQKWSLLLTRSDHLRQVPKLTIVIWLGNIWYFGKLGAEKR